MKELSRTRRDHILPQRKSKVSNTNKPVRSLANLDARSLYEACADAIMQEIAQGSLKPGQRVPSERSIAEALGFTRLTARRALKSLGLRGILEPDERRGWLVRGEPVSEPLNALMGFTEMALHRGLTATSRVISLKHREASFDEAEQLHAAAGSPLIDLLRLRSLDDRPTSIERLRMSLARVKWPDGFDFSGSVYSALESRGVIPARAEAYVGVVDATADEAQLLGVVAGRGLLCMNCVTIAVDGIPISLETTHYHPDRYRFKTVLERRRS